MKTIIELREEAIKEDKNPEFYLYQLLEQKDKEIERLNNIIFEAIDKAKTMKASMLLDAVDGIDIDSQFVHALFELIDFLEKELKEGK